MEAKASVSNRQPSRELSYTLPSVIPGWIIAATQIQQPATSNQFRESAMSTASSQHSEEAGLLSKITMLLQRCNKAPSSLRLDSSH